MAGGRYDGLMREMGGPDVPGVGWAAGIERLAMLLAETPAADRGRSRSCRSAPRRRSAACVAGARAAPRRHRGRPRLQGQAGAAHEAGRPDRCRAGRSRWAATSWRAAWCGCATSTAVRRRSWAWTRSRPGSSPEMESAFDDKLSQILARRDELQALLAEVAAGDYAKLAKEFSDLGPVVETIEAYRAPGASCGELELAGPGPGDARPGRARSGASWRAGCPSSSARSACCCCPRTPTTRRAPSSRSAPAPAATRRPCSPATCFACTSATPTSRAGAARCCR